MQVILIRHGCTPGNLEHRYVGTTDEPLMDAAVDDLKKKCDMYPKADVLFVSPMKRCIQTAELIYPDMEQLQVSDLRECDFGLFEYKNYLELQDNVFYQNWLDSNGTLPFPEGESREEFSKRCCKAFQACIQQAAEKKMKSAAFVVHGGTIMSIMEQFARPAKDYFSWQVKNAQGFRGILEADWEDNDINNTEVNVVSETYLNNLTIIEVEKII